MLICTELHLGVNHCVKPCCGIVKLNAIVDMTDVISSTGFDSNGEPCDYIDEEGSIWIYLGKKHGFDEWGKIPNED